MMSRCDLRQISLTVMVVIMTMATSGCSYMFAKGSSIDEQESNKSILVYGYVDNSEAPFNIKSGDLKQVRPASSEPYKEVRTKDGLIYLENLPLGSYKMIGVEGTDKNILSSTLWTSTFPEPSRNPDFKRLEFRAKKPGLYYMGSYKLDLVKEGGLFSVDKYEMIATKSPTEKQVLKKLVKYAKGTRWEKLINERIRKLKK